MNHIYFLSHTTQNCGSTGDLERSAIMFKFTMDLAWNKILSLQMFCLEPNCACSASIGYGRRRFEHNALKEHNGHPSKPKSNLKFDAVSHLDWKQCAFSHSSAAQERAW